MRKKQSIKEFREMYESLTNPEEQAKSYRREEIKKRIKEKVSDYGLN